MAQEKERTFYTERERNTTVNFTNIDKEDFVGAFGGDDVVVGFDDKNQKIVERQPLDYVVKVGETKQFNMPLADHLAYHLANKIVMRDDPMTSHMKDSPKIKDLIQKILGAKVEKVQEVKIEQQTDEFAELENIKKSKAK